MSAFLGGMLVGAVLFSVIGYVFGINAERPWDDGKHY